MAELRMKVENPKGVLVTLTATMTLEQWQALVADTRLQDYGKRSGPTRWLADELERMTREVSTVIEGGEDGE